ncbi:hypothetical protein [Nitrospira sp. Nam74]
MRTFRIVIALALLLSSSFVNAALETQIVDKECWVELYEDDDFDRDDPFLRLQGPAQYATLNNLEGKDWGNDIESVIMGPNAYMKAYDRKDFKGNEIAFVPNQRVKDLGKFDMANAIDSFQLTCGKASELPQIR